MAAGKGHVGHILNCDGTTCTITIIRHSNYKCSNRTFKVFYMAYIRIIPRVTNRSIHS